jgi:hypothetical protein
MSPRRQRLRRRARRPPRRIERAVDECFRSSSSSRQLISASDAFSLGDDGARTTTAPGQADGRSAAAGAGARAGALVTWRHAVACMCFGAVCDAKTARVNAFRCAESRRFRQPN